MTTRVITLLHGCELTTLALGDRCWSLDQLVGMWSSRLRGVPRGDAQDARASPLPPLCIPPLAMCIPPPQPERLVMRKDEAVGNKKKCKFVYLNN
jgi:hypothetical protein